MAALHPSPEVSTHTSTATRRWTAPAPSKLRDSCHACATSKVRCHKEKPTCSRCAKRGVTCEYFVTKRAGRKHENRSNDKTSTATNTTQAPPVSSWPTNPSASSEMDFWISPSLIQPSPTQNTTSSSADSFPNVFSPIDPFLTSVLTNLNTGFDGFFNSTISFPLSETSDSDILNQSHFYSGDGSSSSKSGFESDTNSALNSQDTFAIFDESVPELPNLSRPHSPPDSRESSTSDSQSHHGLCGSADSPYSCLIRGLGLIKQLSPIAPTACAISSKNGSQSTTIPTIQTVIAENEQIIEGVNNILQCPCSQDGYLLTIMSLIVFKVLGWYAAAAHGTTALEDDSQNPEKSPHSPNSSCHSERVLQHPIVIGSYCLDGEEDLGRMAAQLVLNELHRVQRVVNQLSRKLKAYGSESTASNTIKSTTDGFQNPFLDQNTYSPFSVTMLDQLEADLRKRLCTLSLNIIDMLRGE